MASNLVQYVNFIDFEKTFDSVHRESLWVRNHAKVLNFRENHKNCKTIL